MLTRHFLARPAERVARDLLGCLLVREVDGVRMVGRIVETEAYLGVKDGGSHSFGGRRTPRVEAMYMQAGTAYVYFTYGMHYCMNVVCGQVDEPVAVLIRALEPTHGLDAMRARRGKAAKRDRDLCSGPAKLCQAMEIGPALNTHDLLLGQAIWLESGNPVPNNLVAKTARIGLGTESVWKDKPLRFVVQGNEHVSVALKGAGN